MVVFQQPKFIVSVCASLVEDVRVSHKTVRYGIRCCNLHISNTHLLTDPVLSTALPTSPTRKQRQRVRSAAGGVEKGRRRPARILRGSRVSCRNASCWCSQPDSNTGCCHVLNDEAVIINSEAFYFERHTRPCSYNVRA